MSTKDLIKFTKLYRKRIVAFLIMLAILLPSFPITGINLFAENPTPQNGLRGDYYTVKNEANVWPFDKLISSHLDTHIDFSDMDNLLRKRAGVVDHGGVIWTGTIIPKETGDYTFSTYSDNGVRLYVKDDNNPIIDWWVNDWDKEQTAKPMHLVAGEKYSFKLDYMELTGGSHVSLYWNSGQGKTIVPADVFYYRDGFSPISITDIDMSNVNLVQGDISGNAVISINNLKDTTVLKLVNVDDTPIDGLNKLNISRENNKIVVEIPTFLPFGGYKFVAEDDGIVAASEEPFLVISDNVRQEYPRPDWQRDDVWLNLNGVWDFKFDPTKIGESEKWFDKDIKDLKIIVPFPWESPASGIGEGDYLGTAWYQKEVFLDTAKWEGKRIVIKFGAVDWMSTLYVNGVKVGDRIGGYTPFEYDITDFVTLGEDNKITLMVNDEASFNDNSYTALIGKQGHNAPVGYTHTSGIWQTVILEGRISETQIEYAHVDPNIDSSSATFNINIINPENVSKDLVVKYNFSSTLWDTETEQANPTAIPSSFSGTQNVTTSNQGDNISSFIANIPSQQLWSSDEPNLYEGTIEVYDRTGEILLDCVETYFGQRKIENKVYHTDIPKDKQYEYIYVNDKPVFLSGLLDQGFWPQGIYTAPSADALRYDVEQMRNLGFNLLRKHIKIEDPLQYLWTDRLGMFVWADMPHATNMNLTDGAKGGEGRPVFENALAEMIDRDYNHPSLMAYILFNETWGIHHSVDTDNWIRATYNFAKEKDTSGRLVEDMSAIWGDHIQPTDLHTFHMYPRSYQEVKNFVDNFDNNVYPGSRHNFSDRNVTGGNTQDGDPWLNSEYGGAASGDGDKDVSWCFKYQTDVQRLRQKLNGFVYTEISDIEYECNGIMDYTRKTKLFGYDEIAYGGDMGIKYLTQANYIGIDKDPMVKVAPGGTYTATIGMMRWSDDEIENPVLKWRFDGTDVYGNKVSTGIFGQQDVPYTPYTYETAEISFDIPLDSGFAKFVGTVTVWIEDANGKVIAKNFSNLSVTNGSATGEVDELGENSYALRQTKVASNTIANGVGEISFNYNVPREFDASDLANMRIIAELSSIKAGDGQTQEGEETPTDVIVSINDYVVGNINIADCPRDMRGTLSLNSGSGFSDDYGYLVNLNLTPAIIHALKIDLASSKTLNVKYTVDTNSENQNGLQFYDETKGRYAVSPMVIINPSETYIADSGIMLNGSTELIEANLTDNNYSIETNVNITSGKVIIDAGFEISIENNTVTVKENGETLATSKSNEEVKHIKVVFFDEQVRVYINNNPEHVIDVYGKNKAALEVSLNADNALFVNFTIAPETYENSAIITRDININYVESFNRTDAVARWTNLGTTTDWYPGATTGSFDYIRDSDAGGHIAFVAGTGHKFINHNINAVNLVAEGDFTINSIRSGDSGNVGFIIRGSKYLDNVDGADGYYIGVGYSEANDGYNDGFIHVGSMFNGWDELAKVHAPIKQGETVRLKVEAIGPRIRVYLNDNPEPYVDVYDTRHTSGSIALRGFSCEGAVDNLVISSAPRYAATFEDFTNLKGFGEPNYTKANLAEWQTTGEWEISEGKLLTQGMAHALVGSDTWGNADVSVAITPSNSQSGVLFHAIEGKGGLNGYSAIVDARNSYIILNKIVNGKIIVLRSVPANIGTESKVLRVITTTNSIKIFYDNDKKPKIEFVDNTFLNGKIGLTSHNGETIFDDFISTDKSRFVENFYEGSIEGWDAVKGNWSTSENIMSVEPGTDDKLINGYATRGDFQLDFDLRLDGPLNNQEKYNAGIVLRATDITSASDGLRGYVVGINLDKNDENGLLEIGDIRYGWRYMTTRNVPFSAKTWHHLTVRCEGENIKVYADGVLYIDLNDSAYSYGQIALRNYNAGASYKNIVVRELDDIDDDVFDDFVLDSSKKDEGINIHLENNTMDSQEANLVMAIYDQNDTLLYSDLYKVVADSNSIRYYVFNFDLSKYKGFKYKVFAADASTWVPLCDAIEGSL